MKRLLLLITICISSVSFGQSCFSDKYDVLLYTTNKTFESEDGTIKITFGPSEATMYAGSSKYRYMYENWSYMGSGYKGSVTMMELSGGDGLKLFISCRERMITDNQGTLLYEEGTNPGSNGASSSNSSSVNSVKIGNLEVMTEDLGNMSWEDATMACDNLGDGWRLPTIDELKYLYGNMEKIGGIVMSDFPDESFYWSSTESDSPYRMLKFNFDTGMDYAGQKYHTNYVRAVRAF